MMWILYSEEAAKVLKLLDEERTNDLVRWDVVSAKRKDAPDRVVVTRQGFGYELAELERLMQEYTGRKDLDFEVYTDQVNIYTMRNDRQRNNQRRRDTLMILHAA